VVEGESREWRAGMGGATPSFRLEAAGVNEAIVIIWILREVYLSLLLNK
jgi:hypothetical protein